LQRSFSGRTTTASSVTMSAPGANVIDDMALGRVKTDIAAPLGAIFFSSSPTI
jgi:hypothetical protein